MKAMVLSALGRLDENPDPSQEYPLQDANRALVEVKSGKIRGAKVLRIG